MPSVQLALYAVLALALVISVVTDLRSRMIYDVVTLPTAGLSLVLRFIWVGLRGSGPTAQYGLLPGLVGLAVGFVLFFIMFAFGGMGGGDVKLMAAVGAALGWPIILHAVVFTALVGGLQAIIALLWDGSLLRTLANAVRMLGHALHIKRVEEAQPSRKYVPYGVAIALGTCWAVVWDLTHPIGDLVGNS
jgi:prepilin peptidase CpaA